ncbi:transporter substrate-binding domain-containing protein [Mangrovicoccus ximenensis]|uniref:transporter substrate-binding domain-containing protein n=1 Tax=Mangrovicoccus ximenensis TaxID=1911570 RepID=UPI000D3D3BBF|nr:transporter substrate-binding domain-containing protein [Mangrovicoccus ximenensis]
MITKRSFLAAVLAAATALSAAPMAMADALESIKEAGILRVAVPQDFPPFGSVGTDMKPQGYDIDMARLIATKLNVDLALVPVTSANRIPFLQTGKVDLVISSMGKNPERDAVIDFSDAYAPFYNGVFGPEELEVADASDLSGKTVGVTRGSIEDLELTKIAPDDATLKRYEDNNGTISAFLSGQVDAIATGNVVAAAIIAQNPPKLPAMKFLIKNSPCYIGFAEGEPALAEAVNKIIAEAKEDGALDEISQQWLGMALPAGL